MEKHSAIQYTPVQRAQMLAETIEDEFDRYRFGSVALRREIGVTSFRLTREQEEIYREKERKLWLAIFNPQKLKDEYGITEYSVTEPQS